MTYTPVHNRFWSDGWVRGLNALDRYLFLYLLTNGRARLTGIYELPLDLMASESGIDQRDLLVMLKRLEPKIHYHDGWVIVVNYLKHHIAGGHKFGAGVKAQFEEVPKKLQDIARGYGYPIDTLYIGYPRFPDRIEENRREKEKSKDFSPPSEVKEVKLDQQREEKLSKVKEKRNPAAWGLTQKLAKMIEDDCGVAPTVVTGDYMRVMAALRLLTEKQVIELFEDQIANSTVRSVRGALTALKIDNYRRENV